MAFYTFLIITKTKLNMVFIVLAIVVVCISVVLLFSSSSSEDSGTKNPIVEEPQPEKLIRTPGQCKSDFFRIAGISNYCDHRDIGLISGQMRDNPENEYDPNAVLIAEAHREQLLGYVAKNELKAYRNIAGKRTWMPFVGYIEQFTNEEGEVRLFGVVRTYAGEESAVMADAQKDWDFLVEAFKIRSYEKRMEVLDQFKFR